MTINSTSSFFQVEPSSVTWLKRTTTPPLPSIHTLQQTNLAGIEEMIAEAEGAKQLLEPFLPGASPKTPTYSSFTLAKMSQSTPATTPSKLKLNKPPEFNGSYKDYHSWIQKVKLFLCGLK